MKFIISNLLITQALRNKHANTRRLIFSSKRTLENMIKSNPKVFLFVLQIKDTLENKNL